MRLFQLLFIILFSYFLISCSSTDKSKKTEIIKEKDIELQMIESYEKAIDAYENGDLLFAVRNFNDAEILFPQSMWAPRSALMAAYAYYSQAYYGDAISEAERFVNTYPIITFMILSSILCSLIFSYKLPIGIFNIIFFCISFILGQIILYSVDFLIASSCFWFKNFSVSGWLSHEILKFSTRPDSIYTGILRKVLFSMIPMVLIASIPARILLYGPN